MSTPEASAIPSSQLYTFASDEAEFSIPAELLAEMANWCGNARAWQQSLWCRISSGGSSLWRSARFFATDGWCMLRADFPAKGPWSIDPNFFIAIGRVERALTKAYLRQCSPKGSPKEKKRQREVANKIFLASFELGGPMGAMRVRFGSTDVQALVMPRAM